MKILMVNKFLYPNGGSETYVFGLGAYLKKRGHAVEYFGMEHEGRVAGNSAELYTSNMDFHAGGLKKLAYPLKIIYSSEAKRMIVRVMESFQPDVVHLNNFHFQLTPSILYGIKKYERRTGRGVRIVMTAHDCQLVCPNHMMYRPDAGEICERCLGGAYVNCLRSRCIHGSRLRSLLGSVEGYLYKALDTYRYIDAIVCPSRFLAGKLGSDSRFAAKTAAIHNFIPETSRYETEKKDYVLYFGRFSTEKGIGTLLRVCRQLPDIRFVFAGTGPLEEAVKGVENVKNVGFQTGRGLEMMIRQARFSVYPSECYENCPFSVMESQIYGTPVIAADIGGIPELIEEGHTGMLFESGNADELKDRIRYLWDNRAVNEAYSKNCLQAVFETGETYYDKIMEIYQAGTGSQRTKA